MMSEITSIDLGISTGIAQASIDLRTRNTPRITSLATFILTPENLQDPSFQINLPPSISSPNGILLVEFPIPNSFSLRYQETAQAVRLWEDWITRHRARTPNLMIVHVRPSQWKSTPANQATPLRSVPNIHGWAHHRPTTHEQDAMKMIVWYQVYSAKNQ